MDCDRKAFNFDLDPSVDRCVCCGSYVPEGWQICATCSEDLDDKDTSVDDVAMVRWLSSMSEKEVSDVYSLLHSIRLKYDVLGI